MNVRAWRLFTGMALLVLAFGSFNAANALCLFSCNELDRAKAASLLSALNYGDVRTTFSLGLTNMMGAYNDPVAAQSMFERYVFGSDADAQQIWNSQDRIGRDSLGYIKDIRELAKKGIVTQVKWNNTPIESMHGSVILGIVPQLSNDIRPFCSPPFRDTPRGDVCNAVVAHKKFGSVTGITGDEKTKLVQFTVVTEPNMIGTKLGVQPATENQSTYFVFYDDGWRLGQ